MKLFGADYEAQMQLRSLQEALETAKSELRRFDGKENVIAVANWLTSVRNLTYEIEDVIDEINMLLAHQHKNKLQHLLFGFLDQKGVQTLLKNAENTKRKMKETLSQIHGNEFQVRVSKQSSNKLTRTRKFFKKDPVILQSQVKKWATQLVKDEPIKRDVLSIIGIEGLGKTTMAMDMFNDRVVKRSFKCRAWVDVPPGDPHPEDLLRRILKGVAPSSPVAEDEDSGEDVLRERVYRSLKWKRYLIVMDNICSKKAWDDIKSALPDDKNRSRILFTTRLMEVASHASSSTPFILRYLTPEEGWELLRRKMLSYGETIIEEHERVGKEMAKQCHGLPLAIVALADLLSKEPGIESWYSIARDIKTKLSEAGLNINVLSSQHNLPRHLELCLIYMGIFPQTQMTSARQLIQLWIAEGFIEQQRNKKMEVIGEEYLKELIQHGLVHAHSNKSQDGTVKTCGLATPLLRDICITAGVDQKLFEIRTAENSSAPMEGIPRLIMHGTTMEHVISMAADYSDLRSVHWFRQESARYMARPPRKQLLYDNFKKLRVLNLGLVRLNKMPKEVGRLIYLRYLKMNAPGIKRIPSSLCNLHQLQTLDMRESPGIGRMSVASGIWRLRSLRHLYLKKFFAPEPQRADNYSALAYLETLSGVSPDKVLMRQMLGARFPNVGDLQLSCSSSSQQLTNMFLQSLDHLYHLKSLSINNQCALPDPNAFPWELKRIKLQKTKLRLKDLQVLEKLPNLQALKLLENSVDEEEIICRATSFARLRVLHLVDISVKRWTMGEGAMKNLEHLVIRKCPHLSKFPESLCPNKELKIEAIEPSSTLRAILDSYATKRNSEKKEFIQLVIS